MAIHQFNSNGGIIRLFVYGTLCDPDVRSVVLGGWKGCIVPAFLRGQIAVKIVGQNYPALYPQAVGCVAGLILSGIDVRTLTRVSHYESDEYQVLRREPIVIGHGPVSALVYFTRRDVGLSRRRWKLEEWQRRHKQKSLARIDHWMRLWHAGNPLNVQGLTFVCRQL